MNSIQNLPNQEASNSPARWVFSGSYPYTPSLIIFDLAPEYHQNIINFKDDILGLMLPYTGFDYPAIYRNYSLDPHQKFLHLFNTGDTEKKISAIVDGIAFTTTIPYGKKIILTKKL